jgi:DNA-binding MarR family transcriptional regulator
MDGSRKVVFGILVLSVFVFIISVTSLYVQVTIESGDVCGCLIPLPFFIPFVGSTGLFIGTLVYYLFTPRFERRYPKPDMDTLLNLLGESETRVLKTLTDNNGELSQARLTTLTGISKVKLFRTLERMKARNMIEKRPNGKTNLVSLTEGFRGLFLERR